MPASARRPGGRGQQPPEPQGHFAGLPYDWRKAAASRMAARWWNPADRRLFTPKAYGWGYGLNFYWLTHPVSYFRNRA